jgi:hypothetical protein
MCVLSQNLITHLTSERDTLAKNVDRAEKLVSDLEADAAQNGVR